MSIRFEFAIEELLELGDLVSVDDRPVIACGRSSKNESEETAQVFICAVSAGSVHHGFLADRRV